MARGGVGQKASVGPLALRACVCLRRRDSRGVAIQGGALALHDARCSLLHAQLRPLARRHAPAGEPQRLIWLVLLLVLLLVRLVLVLVLLRLVLVLWLLEVQAAAGLGRQARKKGAHARPVAPLRTIL